MANEENNQDNRDRSKVSSSDDYDVQYLMTKFDLSKNRASRINYQTCTKAKKDRGWPNSQHLRS